MFAIELKNLTSDTLDFNRWIKLRTKAGSLKMMESTEILKKVSSFPPLYLLEGFTLIFATGTPGAVIAFSPIGGVFALHDVIVSWSTNRRLARLVRDFPSTNLMVPPGEARYAILGGHSLPTAEIQVASFKNFPIVSDFVNEKEDELKRISPLLFYQSSFGTHQDYQTQFISEFQQSRWFQELAVWQDIRAKNRLKREGLETKHKLGTKSDFTYKIGSWHTFYKMGALKKSTDFNLRGKRIFVVRYAKSGEEKRRKEFSTRQDQIPL